MKPELFFMAALASIGAAFSCGGRGSPEIRDASQNVGADAAVLPGSGGSTAGTGGVFASGGIATGGVPGSGGVAATGGTPASGGGTGTSTGGTATGASTGGSTASGGTTAIGGTTASGGTTATGGSTAFGGTTATGGSTALGGTTTAGGTTATGGSTAFCGTTATGGTTASGGTSTGGTTATGGVGGAGGATATGGTTNISWDFPNDTQGWLGDFADYPPGIGTGYDLQYGWAALPAEVGPGGGLRLNGNNHSDDLFMYVMCEITGLAPQTRYLLDVVAVIDTNAPADCNGIGGSPGGSVTVKLGASPIQPQASTDSQGWLRLNIDKGNQSVGGVDMKAVGNLGNTNTCPNTTYQSKTFTLSGFSVASAGDGTLWVILGTDSGFEGITTLYYDRIAVTLRPSK